MKCPFCEAEISATARKCRHCGEWIDQPGAERDSTPPPPMATPIPRIASAPAQVAEATSESIIFAVLTFICYVIVYPLGLLLNLIGLVTGPRRGCFLTMFCFLCVLPIGALVSLAVGGTAVGISIVDTNIVRVRQFLANAGIVAPSRPSNPTHPAPEPPAPSGTANVRGNSDPLGFNRAAQSGRLQIVTATAKYGDASVRAASDGHYRGGPNPTYALDGDSSTLYLSAVSLNNDRDQWWQADLGQECVITKVRILWHSNYSNKTIGLLVSRNGRDFTAATGNINFAANGQFQEINVDAKGRYLRIEYLGGQNGAQGLDLNEFEAYGYRSR